MKTMMDAFKKADVPILAAYSKEDEQPSQYTLQKMRCPETGISLVTNKIAKPLSPFVDLSKVEDFSLDSNVYLKPTVEATVDISEQEMDELVHIGSCEHCDTSFKTTSELAKSVEDFHCVVCNTVVEAESDLHNNTLENELSPNFEGKTTNVNPKKDAESNSDDDSQGKVDTLEKQDDNGAVKTESSYEEEDDFVTASDEEETEEEQTKELTLTANLLAVASDPKRIDVVHSGGDSPLYYILLDTRPVGFVEKAKLGETLSKLFDNKEMFIKTLSTALSNGLEKAAEEFAIQPIKIEVEIDNAIAQNLEETRNELEAKFESEKQSLLEKLKQSISIACVALNKEVLKDSINPLKEELIAQLTINGVGQPALVANTIFKNSMDEYIKKVLAHAYELATKSDESRNDFAKLVEAANYRQPNENVGEVVSRNLSVSMVDAVESSSTTKTPLVKTSEGVESIRKVIQLGRR